MLKYKDDILNEREKTHGNYVDNATLAQCLKATIRNKVTVDLSKYQRESLDLICTKIARICTGNPNEVDHWDDIAGYAKLVSSELWRKKNEVGSGKQVDLSSIDGAHSHVVRSYSRGREQVTTVDRETGKSTIPNTSGLYVSLPERVSLV